MKILFVCDYFPPFNKGGGEISSYYQARKLRERGVEIVILAPKYKDKKIITNDNLNINWYPLPFKTDNISPIIFLNPIFIIYLTIVLLRIINKEKIQLIHCQGKYSSPASVIARYLKRIPLIITLRDYKGICNHGFCLYSSKKGCSLISFFNKDFLVYYQKYIKNKNIFNFTTQLIFSVFGKMNTYFLSFFMKKTDKFITVSNYIKEVYTTNGYDNKRMTTIYNFMPEEIENNTILSERLKNVMNKYKYIILYAGKLSLGKGANLLIESAKRIVPKRTDILFIFAGKFNYPIKKYEHSQFLFLEKIENKAVLKLMKLSDLVCIPSFWPEPLSRVIIEAFSLGIPVLASDRGGSDELINNQRGQIFKPEINDLTLKLSNLLKNKQKLKFMGLNAKQYITDLEEKNIKSLINLYESLI